MGGLAKSPPRPPLFRQNQGRGGDLGGSATPFSHFWGDPPPLLAARKKLAKGGPLPAIFEAQIDPLGPRKAIDRTESAHRWPDRAVEAN